MHVQLVQELKASGSTLRVHALTHVTAFSHGASGLVEARAMDGRFTFEAELQGSGILLESGAFQYSVGQIQASVEQQVKGGFFSRTIGNAGTGESAVATRCGWGERDHGHG